MPFLSAHACFRHLLTAGGLTALFGFAPLTHADEILVVTDRQHPVHAPAQARVIELDQAARIEAELTQGLDPDPATGAQQVKLKLAAGGPTLQRRMARAYQDLVDAWSLGITQVPAVVVLTDQHRYVVYGEPDAARAVERITAYRREQR